MALIKSKTLSNGVEVLYWRIIDQEVIHKDDKNVTVLLGGYLSKEVKDSGSTPVDFESVFLEKESYPFDDLIPKLDDEFWLDVITWADALKKLEYTKIKTLPKWEDAQDA